MSAIYIISTPAMILENKYKPGNHKGSQKKLISRYQTYLVDPIICYFRPVSKPKEIESIIKKGIKRFRLKNISDRLTEWAIIGLTELMNYINKVIDDYENGIVNQSKIMNVKKNITAEIMVANFIQNCLEKTNNSKDIVKSSELYDKFKFFSDELHVPQIQFKRYFDENGFSSVRIKTGVIYRNIVFKN